MKRLKIIFLILVILIIFCLFISKNLDGYIESLDISNKLGKDFSGGELSYKEFIILAQNTVGVYYDYLKKGDYEKAYNLFTPEYRSYESSGDYIERISNRKIITFSVNDIVQKSEYMYEAYLTVNGIENETLMIFIEDNEYALAPGEFIKYKILNLKEEKSKIEIELLSSKIELLKCDIKMNIKNLSKNQCEISSIKMTTIYGETINASNDGFKIEAGETVQIDAMFDTEIDFPKVIEIDAKVDEKIKTITFEI